VHYLGRNLGGGFRRLRDQDPRLGEKRKGEVTNNKRSGNWEKGPARGVLFSENVFDNLPGVAGTQRGITRSYGGKEKSRSSGTFCQTSDIALRRVVSGGGGKTVQGVVLLVASLSGERSHKKILRGGGDMYRKKSGTRPLPRLVKGKGLERNVESEDLRGGLL